MSNLNDIIDTVVDRLESYVEKAAKKKPKKKPGGGGNCGTGAGGFKPGNSCGGGGGGASAQYKGGEAAPKGGFNDKSLEAALGRQKGKRKYVRTDLGSYGNPTKESKGVWVGKGSFGGEYEFSPKEVLEVWSV